MKYRWFFPSVVLISALSLSGCSLFPAQLDDRDSAWVPTAWSQSVSYEETMLLEAPALWWSRWNDADLLMLVEATWTNNTDVLVAMANLRAAQASLLSANAALWPTASIGADASNRRTNDVTTENYSAEIGRASCRERVSLCV